MILPTNNIRRKFYPCEEWLYLKVYIGYKSIDVLIKELLAPLILNMQNEKQFEKFHFVRYHDSFPHLRLRLYNSDIGKSHALQKYLIANFKKYLHENTLHKITIDTYTRELERYYPILMDDAESLFNNDSLAIIRFFAVADNIDNEGDRIYFSLKCIDDLLNNFELTLELKKSLLSEMQESFWKEFGGTKELLQQLNHKYRLQTKNIHMSINSYGDMVSKQTMSHLKMKIESDYEVVQSIKNKLGADYNDNIIFNLLKSCIHMFMNRLFISQNRKYELVIYHYLERYYSSALAKNRFSAS